MMFQQLVEFLSRGQLYSTSAAIGSIVYVGLHALDVAATTSSITCVAITFRVRMASVRFNILSM